MLRSNQTTASRNGLWAWNSAAVAMARALDADSEADLLGASVFVLEGTSTDTLWNLHHRRPHHGQYHGPHQDPFQQRR